ncbi:MAG: DUF2203 domain-containing protein [Cyanobacteria bacterium M5B4]|nr:MAG: DUF2203 domain-containing protein [Cyanobacteria bacterium M5B4]
MKHDWEDLTQDLATLETQLGEVKQRLHIVMTGEVEAEELKAQLRQLSPAMKEEVRQITDRLTEIEVTIESRLFNWGALKETFWQIVRFTGLGIIIGVMLQRCAGC